MIKSSTLDSKADHQPTTNNHQPSIASSTGRAVLTKEESSRLNRGRSRVPAATTEIPHSALCTVHSSPAPAVIETKLLPAAPARKIRRNGRIASLPRIQRDNG